MIKLFRWGRKPVEERAAPATPTSTAPAASTITQTTKPAAAPAEPPRPARPTVPASSTTMASSTREKPTMTKYKLEYIWLDGYTPVPNLHGKTQIKEFASFPTLDQLPLWGFDGSSTNQAEGR